MNFLYLSERHFQVSGGKSLLTGLEATTQFGRPDFEKLLWTIEDANQAIINNRTGRIGVFSCGPPGLTKNVDKACKIKNKQDQAQFIHSSENF